MAGRRFAGHAVIGGDRDDAPPGPAFLSSGSSSRGHLSIELGERLLLLRRVRAVRVRRVVGALHVDHDEIGDLVGADGLTAPCTASSASASNRWNRLEARNFDGSAMSWPIHVPPAASHTALAVERP